ncbi:solute carrier family 2, facilitated glucose transporter member 11-like [Lethenteron reissneri]|uniref:solute carrier family 2, facilitated glucose transporter member 11-like n=1 Tax=Lethenteron reissneri TaxID=7753 RepID=UPI002AB709CC|nr:solute carrier family 2, facilitated glucose transporter member 11-like [Lethenteron reissneri]XP_061424544.1 solute carrier family 2, facilitated glucose transporter member 11-like [Lethenteron reissneri]
MQPEELSRTPSVRLLLMALAAGIGGSFQCGFNSSLINVPTKEVQTFINSTLQARYAQPVSDSTLTLLWAVIASVFAVGGLVGALVARPMALLMGRKAGLLANNAFAIIAALLMGVSEVATSFELIIIGRFLIGVNCGAGLCLHPMYLAESAPQQQRGTLAMTTSMFLTVGILVGQIVGLRQVLGGSPLWPVVLALPALPAIVQLLVLPWFPESPRYLLITRKEPKEALKALRWLRRRSVSLQSLKLELDAMDAEQSHAGSGVARTGMLEVLRERSSRRQLVVVVTLNITQQLSGINAIYFYSIYIFKEAEIAEEYIPYVTLGTGAAEILTAVTCGMIIDWLGRRPLLIAGYSLMGLCCILITIGLALQKRVPALSYFSIAIVFAYILSFGIGPGGILNVLPAELFSHHARPTAYSIAGCVNWLSFFVIGIIFPFLVRATGPYCFILFLANSVAGGLLVCCLLPETKNRSFLEVTELFDARRSNCYGMLGTAATSGNEQSLVTLPEVASALHR